MKPTFHMEDESAALVSSLPSAPSPDGHSQMGEFTRRIAAESRRVRYSLTLSSRTGC